jgi:hypothetical protein
VPPKEWSTRLCDLYDFENYCGANGKIASQLGVQGKYSPSVNNKVVYTGLRKGKQTVTVFLVKNSARTTRRRREEDDLLHRQVVQPVAGTDSPLSQARDRVLQLHLHPDLMRGPVTVR